MSTTAAAPTSRAIPVPSNSNNNQASVIIVEVIGYGGSGGDQNQSPQDQQNKNDDKRSEQQDSNGGVQVLGAGNLSRGLDQTGGWRRFSLRCNDVPVFGAQDLSEYQRAERNEPHDAVVDELRGNWRGDISNAINRLCFVYRCPSLQTQTCSFAI
jgi:hypothetical protein